MNIMAIDPGKKGAIALARHDGVYHLELLPDEPALMFRIFEEHRPSVCYLEKAQCMPRQGISSAFNYGRHFGEIIGVLTALKIPIIFVTPGKWTKSVHAGIRGTSAKEKSKKAAFKLLPHLNFLATERSKVPHDGLIDAALIAEFARREQNVKAIPF